MNWYFIYKFSQIWVSDYDDGEFEGHLIAVYELEYKRSMMRRFPFSGMPERKDNIIEGIETALEEHLDEVKGPIEDTFTKWLANHAILNPGEWAQQRVSEYDFDDGINLLEQAASEYDRYVNGGGQFRMLKEGMLDKIVLQMIHDATSDLDSYPELSDWLSYYMSDYQNMLREDLSSEGYEDFGQRWGKEFENEEEVTDFIDELTVTDVDIGNMIYFESANQLRDMLRNTGSYEKVSKELYEKMVFPYWHGYWKYAGIDETRERVEGVFEKLESVDTSDLDNAIVVINIALNESHQTGEMNDYLNEHVGGLDISALMKKLTNGAFTADWDKQLAEVGVRLPETIIKDNLKKYELGDPELLAQQKAISGSEKSALGFRVSTSNQ